MAWEYNTEEVEAYIEALKRIKYIEDNAPKNGADNYVYLIDNVTDYIQDNQNKLQLSLAHVSDRLQKVTYIIEKLETDLDDKKLSNNYTIFANNVQTLTNPDSAGYIISDDMLTVNDYIMSTAGYEFSRLNAYKREEKELTARYFDLKNQLEFFTNSESILASLKVKLTS